MHSVGSELGSLTDAGGRLCLTVHQDFLLLRKRQAELLWVFLIGGR